MVKLPLFGLLVTIILLVLKVSGFLHLSWLMGTIPLWGLALVAFGLLILLNLINAIVIIFFTDGNF